MQITLDDRVYELEVISKASLPVDAPRLAVVSHLVNRKAVELLQACVGSIERFTPEPHEVWVIDNNSPRENLEWLVQHPGINIALNRTEPLPPEARLPDADEKGSPKQRNWGSYANAVGLELAVRLVDPLSRYFMPMHMDVMPCREGWLSFLLSKLGPKIRAAGVRMDKTRTLEGVLHVLGFVVDFEVFRALGLDFFPELPQCDVGDRVTIELRQAGYGVFACANTMWEPDLVERIPRTSKLRCLHVDRALDDNGNPIFLHLGRGLRKSDGEHRKGTTVEEWLRVAHEALGV